MATRLYKIYSASVYNSLNLNNFTSNVVWNLDNTMCILEFKNQPHGNTTGILSHMEAMSVANSTEWRPESNL